MIHIKYGCKDNEKIQGTRINQRKKLTPVEIVLNIVDYHRGKYNCSVPFTGFFFKWTSIYFFSISWQYRFYFVFLQREKYLFDKMQMI